MHFSDFPNVIIYSKTPVDAKRPIKNNGIYKVLLIMSRTSLVTGFLLFFPLLLSNDNIALFIARKPLPPCAKALLTRIEAWENMCFGVEHDLIQG
jgi:hypothetical protein